LYHERKIFTGQPEARKKLGSGGGFQAVFPLTHMTGTKNKPAGKTKTENKP